MVGFYCNTWLVISLSETTVNDFLSQLEGSISEETYTSKITETGGKSGKANVGLNGLGVGFEGNTSATSETSRTFHETPAWRFSHLSKLLEQPPARVQFLSQFDQKKYDELLIGQIVELRARIRRIAWEQVIEELESGAKFMNFAQKMGFYDPSKDPTTQQMMDQLPELKATTAPEETLVIATIATAPAFVVCQIKRVSRSFGAACLLRKYQRKATHPNVKIALFYERK